MSVRNAVAKREEEKAQATKAPTVASVVRHAIETQSNAFKAVLPKTVDADRFSRLVLTAVKSTPELFNCFATEQGKTSVLLAAMQSAAVGLEPNTPTQEAWLLPRRNNNVWECQLMIGYRGYLKLARRSGEILTIFAEVVREGDQFTYARGAERDLLEHIPGDDNDTAPLTHAYAVVRFKDGGYNFIVLPKSQIEKHRAQSDSWKSTKARPYSPWTKWEDKMWRKTAIRSLVPFLDLSADVAKVIEADDNAFVLDDNEIVPQTFLDSANGHGDDGFDEAVEVPPSSEVTDDISAGSPSESGETPAASDAPGQGGADPASAEDLGGSSAEAPADSKDKTS